MSEMKEKLLVEKLTIEKHIEKLKREIAELEETYKHCDDNHFPPKSIFSAEENTRKPENFNIKNIATLLKLSSVACGIHFGRVVNHIIAANVHSLRGTGFAEDICFDFQVTVGKPLIVQSVLLKFEDENLEKELHVWKKKYIKENNFQMLMQGISLYSSLISRMKDILKWLVETYPTLVMIETQDLCGCVVKSAKKCEDGEPIIRLHWKIKWQEADFVMLDRFVMDIGDVDIVTLEARTIWREFLSARKYSVDDLKHFWIEIISELCS